MTNLYRGPPIDNTYQVSFHLAKRFQRRRFIEIDQFRNKNCLWRPCLLIDRDVMSKLYRGYSKRCILPCFVSFGKVVSEKKIFRNRPIRNKNCLCQPCLLMDWEEMSNIYRGPTIDDSYQVSVHFAQRLQRRRFF